MATGSKGGRSYSDDSYGSIKQFSFLQATVGTRGIGLLASWTPNNPITIVDWALTHQALGTGGTAIWDLAATSSAGTSAIGTMTIAGTHAAGSVTTATATETNVATGGTVNLYTGSSVAAALVVNVTVSYRERFDVSDN